MPTENEPTYTVVESRLTTPTEKFYLDLADDLLRETIPRLNDSLSRLLTLSTSLAGGVLVFLKDEVCTGWGRIGAAMCFFLALASAAVGSMPIGDREARYEVSAIQATFDRLVAVKERWIRIAVGFLLAGILLTIAGSTVRANFR